MVKFTLAHISMHLTKDVLEQVFKVKTNSSDCIKSIEITRAAPAGEGLISSVYRINVIGEKHSAKFVVKGLVNDALLRRSLNCHKYFVREALFFSTILPVLKEVQVSSGAKERIQNQIPICYHCHIDGENDYILMEDLSENNAKAVSAKPKDREKDMILQVIAHFHAVSFALRIKNPEIFTEITSDLKEMYHNESNRAWYANYLKTAIEMDKNVLDECESPDSIYYKKFNKLLKTDVYDQLISVVSTRGENPVINHGDAWCSNFLCTNDKAIAIDFQIIRCCSPACDLSYFIILCNFCQNKQDFFEAVKYYYKSLEYYLSDMGLDANKCFSFNTLMEELRKYGKYGLLAALTSIPLLASERCDNLQSFENKYSGLERIPLEELWYLTPIENEDSKMCLLNAIHVAVDVGLI